MDKPYQAMPDIEVLPAHFSVPGAGFLPINSFVIKAKEAVLVDTGMGIDSDAFMLTPASVAIYTFLQLVICLYKPFQSSVIWGRFPYCSFLPRYADSSNLTTGR